MVFPKKKVPWPKPSKPSGGPTSERASQPAVMPTSISMRPAVIYSNGIFFSVMRALKTGTYVSGRWHWRSSSIRGSCCCCKKKNLLCTDEIKGLVFIVSVHVSFSSHYLHTCVCRGFIRENAAAAVVTRRKRDLFTHGKHDFYRGYLQSPP